LNSKKIFVFEDLSRKTSYILCACYLISISLPAIYATHNAH
jgi:hypothetical protein